MQSATCPAQLLKRARLTSVPPVVTPTPAPTFEVVHLPVHFSVRRKAVAVHELSPLCEGWTPPQDLVGEARQGLEHLPREGWGVAGRVVVRVDVATGSLGEGRVEQDQSIRGGVEAGVCDSG